MNAPVTRRALLGATAAVGAAALPALTAADFSAADTAHPDAALFRLIDAWAPLRAAATAAGDRAEAVWSAAADQEPPRPQALRFSGADGLNCGFEVERLPDGRRATVYGLAAIGRLMGMPPPTRAVWQGEPVGGWGPVPDERRIARRAEVLAAHHGWMAQCRAVRERLGCEAADEAEEEALGALRANEAAILSTGPLTLAGLAAKARWASWDGAGANAEAWGRQVLADVLTMAECGGVAP